MPPLSPLLHSQQRTPLNLDQKECTIYIIIAAMIMIMMTICICKCKRLPRGNPVYRLPPDVKLFTLDGREIHLGPPTVENI